MVRPYVKNMREAPSNQAANTTPQTAQPTSRIRVLHATAKGLPHLPQSVLKPLQQSPTAGALLWVPAAGLMPLLLLQVLPLLLPPQQDAGCPSSITEGEMILVLLLPPPLLLPSCCSTSPHMPSTTESQRDPHTARSLHNAAGTLYCCLLPLAVSPSATTAVMGCQKLQ